MKFNVLYLFKRVRKEEHPIRFIISRLLWQSRLCLLFSINKADFKLRFYPSSVSASYWVNPQFGEADEVFVRKYLRRGEVFVDVGANIGVLTVVGAVSVGQSGQVISFEPHPRIFRYLVGNVRRNRLKNVKTYNYALGDNSGVIFLENKHADDMNSVSDTGVSVEMQKLDILVANNIEVALLKIDTEGYEKFVLEGASTTLERCRTIYFEACEEHYRRYGYTTSSVLKLLAEKGFKCLAYSYDKELGGQLTTIPADYVADRNQNLVATRDLSILVQRTGFRLQHSSVVTG